MKFSRREFDRVKFNEPIPGLIRLATNSFKDQKGQPDELRIYVIDMSAGGLRCASQYEFMVNYLSIYQFNVKVNNKDLVLFGRIIRKRNLINHFFEYGVQFNFSYSNEVLD